MMKVYLLLALFCLSAVSAVEEEHQAKHEARDVWSKVGLAWPYYVGSQVNPNNLWALAGNGWNKVSWIYTWNAKNVVAAQQAQLNFVPMFWGKKVLNEFTDAIQKTNSFEGSTHVLGFNEPDHAGEANLSPDEAVSLWKQYIQPLKAKGKILGAPAVTNAPSGKVWLQSFISKCTGCNIDFIPLHWYGDNGDNFINYVKDMRNTFNRNIWITEFACSPAGGAGCGQQQVYNLMGQTTKFLGTTAWVERYAWFGAMTGLSGFTPATDQLLTANGQDSTDLGKQFVIKGGYDP